MPTPPVPEETYLLTVVLHFEQVTLLCCSEN